MLTCSKRFMALVGTIASLGLAVSATQAASVHYQVEGVDVTANTGPGLEIEWAQASFPVDFDLTNGDSYTFDLFHIWTNEADVQYQEDDQERDISATVEFSLPEQFDTTIGGTTVGVSGWFWFFIVPVNEQYGQVTWDGPETVTTSNGGVFSLELSDATFNYGLYGLGEGECLGATVQATITQIASPVVVPTPGAAMGGLALMGTMATMRRRARN